MQSGGPGAEWTTGTPGVSHADGSTLSRRELGSLGSPVQRQVISKLLLLHPEDSSLEIIWVRTTVSGQPFQGYDGRGRRTGQSRGPAHRTRHKMETVLGPTGVSMDHLLHFARKSEAAPGQWQQPAAAPGKVVHLHSPDEIPSPHCDDGDK